MTVYELRRYTLHPGRRDDLIELFEREFIESQEAVGAYVPGHFRDLDRPDHFVWLRRFADMDARREALTAFYGGPVWKAHSAAANATMIDSDDVLLLRPGAGVAPERERPPVGAEPAEGVVGVWIHHFADASGPEASAKLLPAGALWWLVTEYAENDFPGLPVRTGEHVLVWAASFADAGALAAAEQGFGADPGWVELTEGAVRTERSRLVPCGRSSVA